MLSSPSPGAVIRGSLWCLATGTTLLTIACVGFYFYGAGHQQAEESAAYQGRIILSGPIPKGPFGLPMDAQPGQLVYGENDALLGCVQFDRRTVAGCKVDQKEKQLEPLVEREI